MYQFVRAFFKSDDDPTGNLVLDILLDEKRRWVEKVPGGGWWGLYKSDDLWPLILKEGGNLDFGQNERTEESDAPRYASIDICDRILIEGEKFWLDYVTLRPMTLERLQDITTGPEWK